MFRAWVRVLLAVLVAVNVAFAIHTGYALTRAGVSSPDATKVLMSYYRVSATLSFLSIIPVLFLFDPGHRRQSNLDTSTGRSS